MSLKPLLILVGFVIAFVFILSGTSTSVFECRPPDWMKDADGIEASCSWTMFKHSFVGPSDTPGEYVLRQPERPLPTNSTAGAEVSVQRDTTTTSVTLVAEFEDTIIETNATMTTTSGEETSNATGTTEEDNSTTATTTTTNTTNETDETSSTNETNTSETTTTATATNTTELTSADNSSTPTDQTNETTGPPTTTAEPKPTQYIKVEVGLDDMQCKPLASNLRAMGALSILACILSGVGLVFAALPFLGLEHCGTRCHNSIITLTLAAACLVLTLTTWSIGANAYSTKFEASPIVVEEEEEANALYNGYTCSEDDELSGGGGGGGSGRRSEEGITIVGRKRSSAFGGQTEKGEEKDYISSAEGIIVTEETGKAASPPCTLAPAASSSGGAHQSEVGKQSRKKRNVPTCAPYSLKNSPFNVVYASGWALPFTATFVLVMIIFASYHADRSGSGSDHGTNSYTAAGDLNQPIWVHAPAAPTNMPQTAYPHPHQTIIVQQQQPYQQLPYTTTTTHANNNVPYYGVVASGGSGSGAPVVQQQQNIEALLLAEQQRQARAAAAAVRAHPSADYSVQ